jgi:hypothetical protein
METRFARAAVALALVSALPATTAAGGAAAVAPTEAARRHVQKNARALGLAPADIAEMAVSSEVYSAHSGVTHVYLQQQHQGIDVHAAIFNVNVRADGSVLSAGNRFVADLGAAAGGQTVQRPALEAARAAVDHLRLRPTRELRVVRSPRGRNQAATISDGGIARENLATRLVWLPVESALRLAWVVEIEEAGGEHWWNAFVDAETGAVLRQDDLIAHDSAHAIAAAVAHADSAPAALASFAPTDGATYRVFPLPMESPSDGERSLVADAADPAASPFGWHDTDGAPGAEFTITRGNNVHAYADRDNNNVDDPGSSPDGGPGLVFDFALDLDRRPLDSQPAMVTNLFYWNNIVHDVTYGYGFNEVAGNFQTNNYGKGGLGADYVRAEAQDGSGRNNANFGTNVDGLRPRMQMFEWRSATPNPVVVQPPSPIAGTYMAPMAGFGESLVTTGPISGEVVYVGRGCDPAFQTATPPIPLDPYLANPAGKIALIDRGVCTFVAKVRKAEVNGAIMVIVANNIAGAPIAMGGADPAIVIPSVMVGLDDGNLFRTNVPFNVTVSDGTGGVPDRDSDLDAGVIAHEYGHGISNRLTGGPATVACLQNAEQMGEGWSDWFAMTLTTRPDDRPTTARGVGSYVSFEPADGPGIRPTPYTTDTAVNPSTYASVADTVNISQPHGIGYVWNSMLWEVYWNLVDRYGYNADVYGDWTTGGNNRALQYVMDGMKLQPCLPGFVDGRNAILAADVALTGGANQCEIWRGFAKRALGLSASQGSSNNRTDGVAASDLPASCTAAVFGGFAEPVAELPKVNPVNAGATVPVKFTLTGGAGAAIVIDSQPVDCNTLVPLGVAPTRITGVRHKAGEYHVNWRTSGAWEGTCRRLTLRVPAPSDPVAYFRFH